MDMSTDRISDLIGKPRFHFFEGDITINREWVEYHVKKCDVILPLVAIATPSTYVKQPLRVFELDFEANLPIVRASVKYGKHLVFPSTSEVYGMCHDEEFDPEESELICGPINKPRWIYSCSKQLMDRVIHQLLGAGIYPARLVDRAADQLGLFRVEFLVVAHAIYFRSGREHQMLAVLHRRANDGQIGLEVQLEHAQRLLHIRGGRGDRDQRQDHIALLDVVLDPLPVDRDVALEEMETRLADQVADAVCAHVHGVHLPIGRGQNAVGKMVTDKAVHAEYQY